MRDPERQPMVVGGWDRWIGFLLDRLDRHMTNHSWTGLDIGRPPGTELWQKDFLGCFITDPSALHGIDRIGAHTVAWECDFPYSDSTWPNVPEMLLGELDAAGLDDVATTTTAQYRERYLAAAG